MLFLVSEFMIYYVHLYRNVVKLIDFNHYKTTYFLFNQVETHCSFSYKAKQVRNVYWEKSFASQKRYLLPNVCMAPKTFCGGNISQIWG